MRNLSSKLFWASASFSAKRCIPCFPSPVHVQRAWYSPLQLYPWNALPEASTLNFSWNNKNYLIWGVACNKESDEFVRKILTNLTPDCVVLGISEQLVNLLNSDQPLQRDWTRIQKALNQGDFLKAYLRFFMFPDVHFLRARATLEQGFFIADKLAKERGYKISYQNRNEEVVALRLFHLLPFSRSLISLINVFFNWIKREEPIRFEHQISYAKFRQTSEETFRQITSYDSGGVQALILEKDIYTIHQLKEAPGKNIIGIVGLIHMQAIVKYWDFAEQVPKEKLETTSEGFQEMREMVKFAQSRESNVEQK